MLYVLCACITTVGMISCLLAVLGVYLIVFMFIHSCLCVPACPQEDSPGSGLKDQQVLGVWGHCQLFQHSVETLRSQLQDKGDGAELVWDKVTHEHKLTEGMFAQKRENIHVLIETGPKNTEMH